MRASIFAQGTKVFQKYIISLCSDPTARRRKALLQGFSVRHRKTSGLVNCHLGFFLCQLYVSVSELMMQGQRQSTYNYVERRDDDHQSANDREQSWKGMEHYPF